MSGIRIEGDFKEIVGTLNNLSRFEKTRLNKVFGEILVSSTKLRFKEEKDPEGKRWSKSIRAGSEGGQTLTQKGRLKNSISTKATAGGAAIGTNVIYAGVHQKGKEIKAKTKKGLRFKIGKRWSNKKSVKIPKREFLGVSKEDYTDIKDAAAEMVGEHVD